ncbi:unnamed protein product [Phytomonas sp. EM1]|nr:unnamed protein product [Phytomonas sp. EM1]|eukprot:CCW64011.1 unnamed protein product [Phytomonas sp. isolate EM1]
MDEHNRHSKILDSNLSSTNNLFASLRSPLSTSRSSLAWPGKDFSTLPDGVPSKSGKSRRQLTSLDTSSARTQILSLATQALKDNDIYVVSARNTARSNKVPLTESKPRTLAGSSASHPPSHLGEPLTREASKISAKDGNGKQDLYANIVAVLHGLKDRMGRLSDTGEVANAALDSALRENELAAFRRLEHVIRDLKVGAAASKMRKPSKRH